MDFHTKIHMKKKAYEYSGMEIQSKVHSVSYEIHIFTFAIHTENQ